MSRKVPANVCLKPELKATVMAFGKAKGISYSKALEFLLREGIGQIYMKNMSGIKHYLGMEVDRPELIQERSQKLKNENEALEAMAFKWMDEQ